MAEPAPLAISAGGARPGRPVALNIAVCLMVAAALARLAMMAGTIARGVLDPVLVQYPWFDGIGLMLIWVFLSDVLLPLIFAGLIRRGEGWPRYGYGALKLLDLARPVLAHAAMHAGLQILIAAEIVAVVLLFLPGTDSWFVVRRVGLAVRPNDAKLDRPRFVTLTLLLAGILIAVAASSEFRQIGRGFLVTAPEDDISDAVYALGGVILGGFLGLNIVIALAILAVMWTGRNWSRIAFLILVICWAPMVYLFSISTTQMFTLACWGLGGCAILMFSPSAGRWFRRGRA